MSDNDNKKIEKRCQICFRPENQVNDMFSLTEDMCVCSDCLHSMLGTVNSFGKNNGEGSPFGGLGNGFSAFSSMFGDDMKLNPENINMDNPPVTDMNNVSNDKTVIADDNPDEKDDKKEKSGKNASNGFGFPGVSFLNMSDLQGLFGARPKVKRAPEGEKKPIIDLKDIPQPHKIKEMLDEYVVGQEQAKKVMSVAVYNHYKRVASEAMDADAFGEKLKDVEIEKSNMLMIGPTGCGKTYLVKTLAKLLDVPLAITDATSLTEAGYIGDDIESVVSKLLAAADNDVDRAENGIIFIDEIDKIAKKKNTHNRDVSGESVQQGMLKLLEGSEIEVPVGSSSKNAMVPMTTVNTRNILFICGGAFPDLDEIIKQRLAKQTSIGFNAELKDTLDKRKDILKEVNVEDIKKFGMIPEFVGRLPVIFTLEGLNEDMMVNILKEPKNAILKQYQKLFAIDEVDLEFTDDALKEIAKKAIEKDTGARALRSIIEEMMLDIMYEIPKDINIGKVAITKEYILGQGGPQITLRGMEGVSVPEIAKKD